MSDVASLLAEAAAFEQQGDARRAALAYQRVLAVEPDHPTARQQLAAALYSYGNSLRSRGALAAAVTTLAGAARLLPEHADAWFAVGNACMALELSRVGKSRVEDKAVDADDDPLANALYAFSRAAKLRPADPGIQANFAMASRYACAFDLTRSTQATLRDMAEGGPLRCEPMTAIALIDDASAQRQAIEGWTHTHLPAVAAPAAIRRRGTRLRVGYLSSDLHDHATAHLAAGLFEMHDRTRCEVFAYALDRDDGSAMRARLRSAFDAWRDIREVDDAAAARQIAADAIDVLVDLKGHTQGARMGILAQRPASVQIHYLGFPGTIAYGGIDGFVADDVVAPVDGEFAEPLLRLPVCYQVNDAKRELPPATSRDAAGLPEHGLVLASFNQTYKIGERFLDLWIAALRENADAVLWLSVPHALARRNVAAYAERRGVDGKRIVFAPMLPQAQHVARLRCADLVLDVLPYGSHTTGSDALFAGVPLLTCRGTTFAGRVGASLCTAARVPDLIAESVDAYAQQLRALARDRDRLRHYKDHLDRERSRLPLFDTESFTRAFERMLEGIAR